MFVAETFSVMFTNDRAFALVQDPASLDTKRFSALPIEPCRLVSPLNSLRCKYEGLARPSGFHSNRLQKFRLSPSKQNRAANT